MGQTFGRDEKIMQNKRGKKHKSLKGVKKIEGDYFSVVFDEIRTCVCARVSA
jgi:hypothetical protein